MSIPKTAADWACLTFTICFFAGVFASQFFE